MVGGDVNFELITGRRSEVSPKVYAGLNGFSDARTVSDHYAEEDTLAFR